MIRNLIIAASTVALLATAAASTASAKVHVDLNLNLGGGYPGYYPEPYPVYPVYPVMHDGYDGYDDYDGYDSSDCGYEYITVKKWNRYHSRYRILHKRVWVCN
jgi:hypothetical protein